MTIFINANNNQNQKIFKTLALHKYFNENIKNVIKKNTKNPTTPIKIL